jgi:hypothetical protein
MRILALLLIAVGGCGAAEDVQSVEQALLNGVDLQYVGATALVIKWAPGPVQSWTVPFGGSVNLPCNSQVVGVDFNYRNGGTQQAGYHVNLGHWVTPVTQTQMPLGPGQTRLQHFGWNSVPMGWSTITLILDEQKWVDEGPYESNNQQVIHVQKLDTIPCPP